MSSNHSLANLYYKPDTLSYVFVFLAFQSSHCCAVILIHGSEGHKCGDKGHVCVITILECTYKMDAMN